MNEFLRWLRVALFVLGYPIRMFFYVFGWICLSVIGLNRTKEDGRHLRDAILGSGNPFKDEL